MHNGEASVVLKAFSAGVEKLEHISHPDSPFLPEIGDNLPSLFIEPPEQTMFCGNTRNRLVVCVDGGIFVFLVSVCPGLAQRSNTLDSGKDCFRDLNRGFTRNDLLRHCNLR
ncbi:MAG: hypothetical protein JW384_03457 [Nitrosomonadaceae bacterium]|nr:hypothetical protein [Nitrosomonadaceae bacterium]